MTSFRQRPPGCGRFAIFVLMAVLTFPAYGDPAAEPPPILDADAEQLRQVLIDNRIETGRPRPGLSLYARDAGLAFSQWLANGLSSLLPGFARLQGTMIEPILKLLLALVTAVLLGFVIRFALLWWRRRSRAPAPAPIRELDPGDGETPVRLAPYWQAELRRHLDERDVPAATLALWWWLARSLVGKRAEPSWTTRELIARAGRRDLAPPVRRLDRMIYGSERPSADAVDHLWRDLREAME